MEMRTLELPGADFSAALHSYSQGGVVSLLVCGVTMFRWAEDDYADRDVFIAAAHEMGLKGKTIALLAFTSQPTVTRVLTLVREGGRAALRERPVGGRKAVASPALRTRMLELRKQGMAFRKIARALGLKFTVVANALKGVPAGEGPTQQFELPTPDDTHAVVDALDDASPTSHDDQDPLDHDATESPQADANDLAEGATPDVQTAPDDAGAEPESPRAASPLNPSPHAHPCRYAGTLLVACATLTLGLRAAMERAQVTRPDTSDYSATQAMLALVAAWSYGYPSLEAMHEADARSLGVVLGLERSPSVRTLHRAIAQMRADYDPVQWWVGWMCGVMRALPPRVPVFGVDGHFKRYAGEEPIDKGYNTKRRVAEKGLQSVKLMGLSGVTYGELMVGAADRLGAHLTVAASALEAALQDASLRVPVILAFDRGGFSFETLSELDAAGYCYLAWVPASVALPALEDIAPEGVEVGQIDWTHPSIDHPARLLVERDGARCIPAVTNLPAEIDAATALSWLRAARGMQENAIKAARAHAHIDRLEDRGAEHHRPDDRLVRNPEHAAQRAQLEALRVQELELLRERANASGAREIRRASLRLEHNALQQSLRRSYLREEPARVPRMVLRPEAQRAELDVSNRQLLMPLKNATENARRWLLGALGAGLSPSDEAYDQDTRSRTLEALIEAPGAVVFGADRVEVTLELPIAPKPHRRLAAALVGLDDDNLCTHDGRRIQFRLAERPTRSDIPGVNP